MSNIAIVGGGAYGTALARVLSDRGHRIGLHVRETDVYRAIVDQGINAYFLPTARLDTAFVQATTELAKAIRGSDFVFIAIPAPWVRTTLIELKELIEPNAVLVLTSKGLENSGKTVAQVASEILPRAKLCGLYGITFAKAIATGQRLASMCAASSDLQVARTVASLFFHDKRPRKSGAKSSGNFRIYLSTDLRGAELGGALKNVYSIAMGLIDQYLESTAKKKFQEPPRPRSSRYTMMNLCMLELLNFGLEHGAQIETLVGPSGIGDFAACASTDTRAVQSRNYDYGRWKANSELERDHRDRAPESHEGHDTVLGASRLLGPAKKSSFPILMATHDILFEAKKIKEVMPNLLQELAGSTQYVMPTRKPRPDTGPGKSELKPQTPKAARVAFVSYRFPLESFVEVVKSIAQLLKITIVTGKVEGPTQHGLDEGIARKIRAANFYIAIFPNDKSRSPWLRDELICAKNARKPTLVLVEDGASVHFLKGILPKNLPYHRFSKETFGTIVSQQLSAMR